MTIEAATDAGAEPVDDAASPGSGVLAPLPAGRQGWRARRPVVAVLVVGLLVTAGLAWGDAALYDHNEGRLLGLRARELGSVLTAAVPSVQTTLASAVSLADATAGNAARFRAFMAPDVGPGRTFVSASLWAPGASAPSVVVGVRPDLVSLAGRARRFLGGVRRAQVVSVIGLLEFSPRRIGYAFSTPGNAHGFVIYAESVLPARRSAPIASSSAFSDLNYALYLGRSERPRDLLITDLAQLPPAGQEATDRVAFGTSELTLLVTARSSLGGAFFMWLRWIIAALGVLVTLAAAGLTDRLVRGRHRAELLARRLDEIAEENRTRYQEQRGIASVLQHALLPDTLASLPGLEVSARYEAGSAGVEIGGDWYELFDVSEGCVLAIVGDVSGHDLQAATTMASLRHSALSFASLDASPAVVLGRLSDLVARAPHRFFATVLCVLIDVEAHEMRVASAGHLPPLLVDGQRADYVEMSIGVPVGAASDAAYTETTVRVGPRATVVAFTDGLVERRGEIIDAGLARLRTAATESRTLPLDDLVAKITRDLATEQSHDDTAILAVRWQS